MLLAQLHARQRFVSASVARRRARAVPRPVPPTGLMLDYAARLHTLTDALDAAVHAALRDYGSPVRLDAAPLPSTVPHLVAALRRRFAQLLGAHGLTADLAALASRVGRYTKEQWARQVKTALGIDLLGDPNLARLAEDFRRQNLALIQDLGADKLARVEQTLHAYARGQLEDLPAALRATADLGKNRATLIARTEVAKLASQMTRARHEAAGVHRFTWSTSRDSRVRESHRALEGEAFAYARPPVVDGEPALPGQTPRCRCVALPILPEVN